MKRTIYILVGLLMVASMLLTACGPAVETPVPTEEGPMATEPMATDVPMEPVTITIWHQWSGDYLVAITNVFNEYMTLHPEVTIDLSKPDDVTAALQVAVPAGEGPDIIGWANDQIGANALAGNIVALDDYGVDMAFLDSTYEPAAVSGVVWQGMIWALPESQEGIALVYNKALVDPAIDLPTDPMDFAGLLAKAQAFYEANGIPLFCNQGFAGGDAYHIAPVYFGFGVPSYVDDQGVAYLNTPEAIAAGEWLLSIKPYLASEQSDELCSTAFAEGQVGARWTGPWAISGIENAGIDYGIAAMGSPFVGIKTLMLTKNGVDRGHAEVSVDIMKFFTSYEMQKQMTLANKTIPANTEALNDPEVQALITISGFGAALNSGVTMSNTPFASAQWGPVGDATGAIWNGSQTPQEALAAAQTAIDDAIAGMK
jgi:arabinogalactan oligomer/maltooligosaccharide transport system substrate-binding protein